MWTNARSGQGRERIEEDACGRAYAAYGLDGTEWSSKPWVRRMPAAPFEPCGGEQKCWSSNSSCDVSMVFVICRIWPIWSCSAAQTWKWCF